MILKVTAWYELEVVEDVATWCSLSHSRSAVYLQLHLSHKSRREHHSDKCLYCFCSAEPIKHVKHAHDTRQCTQKNADNKVVTLIYTHDFLLFLLRYNSTLFIHINCGLSLFEEVWHSEVSENPLKDVVYTRCNKVVQDEKHSYIFLPVQPQQLILVEPPAFYLSVHSVDGQPFIHRSRVFAETELSLDFLLTPSATFRNFPSHFQLVWEPACGSFVTATQRLERAAETRNRWTSSS